MLNELVTSVEHFMQHRDKSLQKHEKYSWLSNKKKTIRLNVRDEFAIRQLGSKLSTDECYTVLKELQNMMKRRPMCQAEDIPKICVELLNKQYNMKLIISVVSKNRNRRSENMITILMSKVFKIFGTSNNRILPVELK